MDITRIGRLGDKLATAQGVELLLEHQSIPSKELNERIAFALKKDFRVRNKAPPKLSSVCLFPGLDTRTVLTTFDASMVPSFFRSLAGLSVPFHTPVLKSDSRALSRYATNASSSVGRLSPDAISALI